MIWGEMGRTPRASGDGRDHWLESGFSLFVGGGLQMGQVIGATDRLGGRPVGKPYTAQNVLSMVYRHVGIDPERTTIADASGRPHYVLTNPNPIVEL